MNANEKKRYRDWMKRERWSASTIRHAMTFLDYLEKKGLDWENLTYESAEMFILSQDEKGVKPKTLNGWIRQINRWLNYQGFPERLKYYPLEGRKRRVYIPDKKVKEMLELSWGDIVLTRRNRAIMHVLFGTAIRIGELVALDLNDVDLHGGFLTVQRGKGGKMRTVPLPSSTVKALQKYLEVRIESDPNALFTSRKGRMWDVTVRRIVKEAGNRVGVVWMHPHAARHWRAKNMLKEGIMVSTVAEILGHSDLKTTLQYLGQTDSELRDDVRKKDLFFEKEVKT